MGKQVINGHAFEFSVASAFNKILNCGIVVNSALKVAEKAYIQMDEAHRYLADQSACDVAQFLIRHDKRLNSSKNIVLQSSASGKDGDVRDVVIDCDKGQVGISAKHRHYAVKHPRLSGTIDFGKLWGGHPVSSQYWKRVRPIFDDLAARKSKHELFRDIKNKDAVIYLPILNAFEDELKLICEDYGRQFIGKFFHYLIGKNDFYKVVCDRQESVVESININGTLAWGSKWKIPHRIESIKRVRGSASTLVVIFEQGWQIKFRLHNASSRVEPSLKFDVTFIGMSSKVSRITLSRS